MGQVVTKANAMHDCGLGSIHGCEMLGLNLLFCDRWNTLVPTVFPFSVMVQVEWI